MKIRFLPIYILFLITFIAEKILPEYAEEESGLRLCYIHSAENIAGYSVILKERSIQLSEHSLVEVAQIKAVCTELLEHLLSSEAGSLEEYEKVAGLEQKIDDMTEIFRGEMMGQIQKGLCSEEGSILFSEMLTDFERIGDHALNISKEMTLINR